MSYLYEMGLRGPRCNGCKYLKLKHELADKFLALQKGKWVTIYELDAKPIKGQSEPLEHEGRPIRFRIGFASIGHSDECYHWQPPVLQEVGFTLITKGDKST